MTRRTGPSVALAALCALTMPATALAADRAGSETAYTVDSTADLPDADPGDGACRSSAGSCTLRAAVMASNARPGRIAVPAGRFELAIKPNPLLTVTAIPDPPTGDLNVLAPTTITGAGAGKTIIDARGVDRIFSVTDRATITDLTITGGVARKHELPFITGGGGILNTSDLKLRRVEITSNKAGYGGGIFSIPGTNLSIEDSVVSGNEAGEAGGIRFDWWGSVKNTRITGNKVVNPNWITHPASLGGRGGGIDLRGPGPLAVTDSVITGNSATDAGSGINAAPAYLDSFVPPGGGFPLGLVILKNTTLTGNTGSANCARAFAAIVVDGGTVDPTCR